MIEIDQPNNKIRMQINDGRDRLLTNKAHQAA